MPNLCGVIHEAERSGIIGFLKFMEFTESAKDNAGQSLDRTRLRTDLLTSSRPSKPRVQSAQEHLLHTNLPCESFAIYTYNYPTARKETVV